MIITEGNGVPFSLVLGPALLKMCVLLKSHVLMTLFASDTVLISRSTSIISAFEMDII